jgi:hypothetical protein
MDKKDIHPHPSTSIHIQWHPMDIWQHCYNPWRGLVFLVKPGNCSCCYKLWAIKGWYQRSQFTWQRQAEKRVLALSWRIARFYNRNVAGVHAILSEGRGDWSKTGDVRIRIIKHLESAKPSSIGMSEVFSLRSELDEIRDLERKSLEYYQPVVGEIVHSWTDCYVYCGTLGTSRRSLCCP